MKSLLILDLDETLIHSSSKKLKFAEDFMFEKYYVYKRPKLDWFLEEISKHYNIGIWSSADGDYVMNIVEHIIPKSIKLELLWDKDWCDLRENNETNSFFYEKKLDKISNLNLGFERLLLIDDSFENYQINKNKAYLIKPFKGEKDDIELVNTYNSLISILQK